MTSVGFSFYFCAFKGYKNGPKKGHKSRLLGLVSHVDYSIHKSHLNMKHRCRRQTDQALDRHVRPTHTNCS